MTMSLDAFPLTDVAEWLTVGAVIPFLGAGASRAGVPPDDQLPDGRGLARELITRMGNALPRTATVLEDLPKIAQFYEASYLDRPALYSYLYERLEGTQRNAPLSHAAMLLAAVPDRGRPLFIITTNYDTLIERAFAATGRPLCVITQNMRDPEFGPTRVTVTAPGGTNIVPVKNFRWEEVDIPPNGVYLFKMHGSVNRQTPDGPDNLIITEDDYVDFLVNTGSASSPFFPPPSLLRAYKERRFLFLGYSLQDWNFRAFLRLLVRRNALSAGERRRHWAIQRDPDELDAELWRQRNVNVYDGDLIEFCKKLRSLWSVEEVK
jgi:hypothetical protein